MSYQVIARKWRPRSFTEVVGQDHISTTLLNALRHDRLPQALLFTGPRGTGKTSSARILAKSLRCPQAKNFVPCGECATCEDVGNGRSLDVIEIDGASNNGVDAVRELRDTVGYMPSSGKYKVYIIDEVHMLSTSAFNALLKTLEEPPPHVVFIMATTEVQKIPNTILSRCQRFDFRRISTRQIAKHLESIVKKDGHKAEQEALWLIARQADGSMRDSQSLLDQVITYCDGEVSLKKVIDVLGLTDRALLLAALKSLTAQDAHAMIDVIEKVFHAGYDPKIFAQDLLEEIRHALMIRLCPDDATKVVDLPDAEIQALKEASSPLSNEDLHMLFDMALKGVNDLLRSQDARLVLEMLLLRMTHAPRIVAISQLLQGKLPQMMAAPSHQTRATPPTSATTKPAASARPVAQDTTAEEPAAKAGNQNHAEVSPRTASSPSQQPSAIDHPPSAQELEKPKFNFVRPASPEAAARMAAAAQAHAEAAAHAAANPPQPEAAPLPKEEYEAIAEENKALRDDPWFQFVSRVKKSNAMLGAMLENTFLMSQTDSELVLGIPKKVSFLFDKVADKENLKKVETFLETFWNKKYTVTAKLADEKTVKATEAAAPTPKAVIEKVNQAKQKTVESQVETNALVRSVQDVFKGQIKSIKEKR